MAEIKIALPGQSRAGKTYPSLQFAYILCSDCCKVAPKYTENRLAILYSHLRDYKALALEASFLPNNSLMNRLCRKWVYFVGGRQRYWLPFFYFNFFNFTSFPFELLEVPIQ